ncbi:hypothetical protein [Thalassotalea euphylliae]|uniref:Uncharacterized protein n=1 Tax=Thalassotalea euphylliae TaxID=1655234 RepID=A0A3E0U1Y0_9GAMM|nr:hypothetical protein [Thalassotalea euphylliae]REL30225.1 hypothetical protein DXX94_05620 [Thalassotalea euphylliae]
MFKKTLIAAAVATTASFGAAASTVSVTADQAVGVEYAQGIKVIEAQDITVALGRDYAAGDIITVTVSGATIVTEDEDEDDIVLDDPNGKLEFLGYKDNAVRYLVTEAIEEADAEATFVVEGLMLNIASAAAKGAVKVSAAGRVDTVDGAIDVDASKSVTAYNFVTELSSEVTTKFDGVIDVNEQRLEFTENGTADTLTITNTVAATDLGVTTGDATYTVYGDFSFLDADGDGELGGDDDGTVTIDGEDAKVADDFLSVSLETDFAPTTAGSATVDVVVTGPEDVVIPDQSFMASTTVDYTVSSAADADEFTATTLDKAAAGSWTLNGAKAHVALMYVGPNYAQAVTVSNTSTQTGGVDVTVYVGGDAVTFEGVATAQAEGVTDISVAVRKAIADAGITDGVVSFDVVVNTPSASTEIKALYFTKSDADRVLTK